MDEEKKIRTEKALSCIKAIEGAVIASQRWAVKYPAFISTEEKQHILELYNHLDKLRMITRNLSNKLMLEFPRLPETEPFVEVEDVL